MATKKITKDMAIEEILQNYPTKSQELGALMAYVGLHCVGCNCASSETLEEGMQAHGMSKKEITNLVNALNDVINNKLKNITFTEFAAEKCKGFRKNPNHMFKVTLEQSENKRNYMFKFKEEKSKDELEFKDKDIKILVNKKDVNKLSGAVIDYVEDGERRYFKILKR